MATTPTADSIGAIAKEVKLLRSLIIGLAGRDKEGTYRPEFVRRILRAAGEKPTLTFADRKSFLSQLHVYSR